ncbi:MAG TPA: Rv2578c family radical SAM protein [Candidatus Limnocylindrales bacterium]
MRWIDLTEQEQGQQPVHQPTLPGAVTRTFDTPGFAGITFYEVRAKSIINHVKGGRLPFEYTINPYRGCSHACTYCLLGDTPILMADGGERQLASLSIGDEIIGTVQHGRTHREVITKVLAKWPTLKSAYRVVLADGRRIVASGDHRFLTTRGWRHVANVMFGTQKRPYLTVGNLLVGRNQEAVEVTAIEPLGRDLPMWDITTGTGDFIANGVISHNCFARHTHTYLDLDAGHDFDSKIVVKVNAVELLRRELSAPRWEGHSIAMGTNVDVYQRAEGRYRLMPGIIEALHDKANPFSILTKSTLILRDLPLIRAASERARVSIAFSIGFTDERLWRLVESGTPSPSRRMDAVRQFTEAGMRVGVMMAPILPGLSDTEEEIDTTVRGLVEAGAASVTPLVLHLRPGAREWFMQWMHRERRDLIPLYERIYRDRAYASADFQRLITARVRRACRRYGLDPREEPARLQPVNEEPHDTQPTLL